MHVRHIAQNDGWKSIDSMLLQLSARKGELDAEIGRWLLLARREGVHRHLGCASFTEYAGRRFGYDEKTVQEKVRVAEALEQLPELRNRLERGACSWSVARELTRVAKPETEAEWIAKTDTMTVRQVEALVARREPGDRPSDQRKPPEATYRIVNVLPASDYADYLAASELVRKEIGAGASQADVFRAMVQMALGTRDVTKPGYQVTATVCIHCTRTWREDAGKTIEVPSSVGERARCDGTVVGATSMDGEPAEDAAPETTAHVGAREVVRALRTQVRRGGSTALIHLVTEILAGPFRTVTRSQRRAVFARDHHRCVVNGCTHFRYVDVHHLVFQELYGPNALDNLVTLCTQHHDLLHAGYLAIEGKPSTGLVFREAHNAWRR